MAEFLGVSETTPLTSIATATRLLKATMSDEENEMWGWKEFFEQIEQFISESGLQFGNCSHQYASYVVERMGLCITSTSNIISHMDDYVSGLSGGHHLLEEREVIDTYKQQLAELNGCLRELSREWLMFLEVAETAHSSVAYRATVEATSRRGRPRFEVSSDQIEYLRSLCFSWTDISSLLGISRMTLYRRRQEFGLGRDTGATLDAESLKRVLREVRREHPDIGEKMMIGRLRSMGYYVSRARVREAIRETDPINTALRWQGVQTSRRRYSVPGPNSLWHIGMSLHYTACWACLVHTHFVGGTVPLVQIISAIIIIV